MCVCRGCGASVKADRDYCAVCGLVNSTEKILEVGEAGRAAAQSAQAQASRAETQRRNTIAQQVWKSSSGLSFSHEMYDREIRPQLRRISISALATALSVSWSYAAEIRRASAAHINGTGKNSRNLSDFRWERSAEGLNQFKDTSVPPEWILSHSRSYKKSRPGQSQLF